MGHDAGVRRGWVVEAAGVAAVTAWLGVRAGASVPSTLWLDDAWLALVTRADSAREVVTVGVTAPGFAALLRGVHEVTGTVEGLVRVALVLALLVPAAVYAVGRRAFALGPAGALTAAVVAGATPVLVTYAGRVKPFTADALLATAVLGAAAWAVAAPEETRRWWTLAATSIAAVAVSATPGVTVLGAVLAAPVVIGRPRLAAAARAAAPAAAVGAAVAAVWWAVVLGPATNEGLRRYWDDFHTLDRAPDAAAALLPLDGTAALLVVAAASAIALLRSRTALLLVAPLAVAAVLGLAGAIPLGGGRTDAHLVPAVALLIGASVDVAGARSRQRVTGPVLAAASIAVVALVAAPDADPYPAEDLGPLVAAAEREAQPTERILVYSSARWAYALETASPVDLVRSRTEANGFEVTTDDARTTILPRLRDHPDRYPDAVDAAVGDSAVAWLLVSHPGSDVAELEAALLALGFEVEERRPRPGAELSRWERPATR